VFDRSSFSCVGSVFRARGAVTEQAVSPFVDVSAARRGRQTTKHAVQIA